jgi:hypothetical protein
MSDKPDTNEVVPSSADVPFDVASYDPQAAAQYIARAKKLKAEGFYDIETYRKRGDASRPAS